MGPAGFIDANCLTGDVTFVGSRQNSRVPPCEAISPCALECTAVFSRCVGLIVSCQTTNPDCGNGADKFHWLCRCMRRCAIIGAAPPPSPRTIESCYLSDG